MLEYQLIKGFYPHRPKEYTDVVDHYLPKIAKQLIQVMKKIQERHIHNSLLYLSDTKLQELAGVLVEFAEDIHNDIGLWKSYENYNLALFNSRLPLTLGANEDMEQKNLNEYRIWHLLWIFYSKLNPELILSPTNKDLRLMASVISDFQDKIFAKMPQGSGIKNFLTQPNKYGWEVKKKLLWLGRHSYLFRHSFQNYIEMNGGTPEIFLIDDFVCHQTTSWSGLGAIDILAESLDISEKQGINIRRWYEKHMAYYKVLSNKGPHIEVINIINDKPYTIRVGENSRHFKSGQLVFGELVPWNKEWYWSGKQLFYADLSHKAVERLKNTFIQKVPRIAYRYCPQQAKQARAKITDRYYKFVNYHGQDLVIYPDGHSMVADLLTQYKLKYNPDPKHISTSNLPKNYTISSPGAGISSTNLIESKNGIGVYFNPDEGREMIDGFNFIERGFEKKGVNLTEEEENSIRSFICSNSVSPGFVKKLVQKYGDESIVSVFLIPNSNDKFYLEYLLRQYKGSFFRQRHPDVAFSYHRH